MPPLPPQATAPRASRFSLPHASLVLLGLACVLPFLQPYHRNPITAFYSEWLAFALGLAAASLLLRKESWRDAAVPAVVFAPLGLVLVLGLQAMLGRVPYPEQALVAALYLLWAALMMVLGLALRRDLGLAPVAAALAWFVLAGGLLSALAGLLQHYHLSTPLDALVARKFAPGVYGNLGQSNHYAAYMTMALAAAAYLYGRGRLHGGLAATCSVLFLLMLALSGSRSPWLYLGVLAAFGLVLHRLRGETESRRLAVTTLCLLPGFVVAQWLATQPFMTPDSGLLVTSAERLFQIAGGIEPRRQLAREAWDMFLDAPVLGAGWGQFAWHHYQYQAVTGATAAPGVFNHAHNVVLQLLSETGAAGTLFVAGGALAWLAGLRRVRLDLEWWWLLALLAVIGIHSMLEYPLWYAYFLGVAALLMGLGEQRAIALRLAGSARLVVVLALVIGWLNLLSVLPQYREFERRVFFPEGRGPPPAGEMQFADAIADIHREPLLTPYVELALAMAVPLSSERLHERLELNARAMRFAPVDVVVYRRAALLALAGEREAALRQFTQAARAYPGELPAETAVLRVVAGAYPAEMTPLLELATALSAEQRAARESK